MREPWHKRQPEVVQEILDDLRESYPNLHLHLHLHIDPSKAEVRGTFPVRAPDGRLLDQYQVSIELLADYPKVLPVVREVGGRLPWSEEFHVERNGNACVLMPDDRWRCFPEDVAFVEYLDGPLHNFFLSQIVYAEKREWPFGQWGHGKDGIYEYYRWLLETDDDVTIQRVLHILAKGGLKKHYRCPCGSGKNIRRCCSAKLRELRQKISSEAAASSLKRLGLKAPPYKRAEFR